MKTARILVVLTSAALLFATLSGCSGSPVSTGEPETTSAGSPRAGIDAAVQSGTEPHMQGPAVSAAEAKAQTGISLRVPKNTQLTGELKGIYPNNNQPQEESKAAQKNTPKAVTLLFTNGLGIEEEACPVEPDWAAEAAIPTMNGKPPDEIIGAQLILTKVAGFQGMFTPEWTSPGPNPYKLPPQLQWWENGVRYHMLPWKLGYTVEQLMEIANSMY